MSFHIAISLIYLYLIFIELTSLWICVRLLILEYRYQDIIRFFERNFSVIVMSIMCLVITVILSLRIISIIKEYIPTNNLN